MKILNFSELQLLLVEKLSINKSADLLAQNIQKFILDKNDGVYSFFDIPDDLQIDKIIINLNKNIGSLGEINLNKSKLVDDKWAFYLDLKFKRLDTIEHECNHIIQILYKDKKHILNKLNYIKALYHPKIFNLDLCKDLLYYIYLSSESEINSKVSECYGLIKDTERVFYKINKKEATKIIFNSESYTVAKALENYNIYDSIEEMSRYEIDLFFTIYETNKLELDKINDNNIFIKTFKNILKPFSDMTRTYKITRKNRELYYQNWINSQGLKLKTKLFKLVDHFD